MKELQTITQNALSSIIEANKLMRPQYPTQDTDEIYLRDFCTLSFGLPQRCGKTVFIQQNAGASDCIITLDPDNFETYKSGTKLYSPYGVINATLGTSVPRYDTIWINECLHIVSLENIIRTFAKDRAQTFVSLGWAFATK